MNKYGIQSLLLTMLSMSRINLITKEQMKDLYKGKLINPKSDRTRIVPEVSINDDLESFFIRLQEDDLIEEEVRSFFLPKLTEEELKLVEDRNAKHLKTYMANYYGFDPDVDVKTMLKSNSKSKYMYGYCSRTTVSFSLK